MHINVFCRLGCRFLFFLQSGNDVTAKETMLWVFILVSAALPFAIFCFIREGVNWLSVFEITENGIKQSLFNIFKKKEINWDEMPEIWCYEIPNAIVPSHKANHDWLFFSTSKSNLTEVSCMKLLKRKDTIGIYLTKKDLTESSRL